MPWQQLICHTDKQHQAEISAYLESTGCLSTTYQDTEDSPILEPLPGEIRLWEKLTITALYAMDDNVHEIMASLNKQQAPWKISHVALEILEDQQWERSWMENFKPMQFGKNLWVYPNWAENHHSAQTENTANITPDRIIIQLDPGLAFGTGTHETTSLCLEWLDAHPPIAQQVLDYGCGSGILSLAAAKLGATQVDAVDIDTQALSATTGNAEKNHIPSSIIQTMGTKTFNHQAIDNQYDLVIANILYEPLITLSQNLLHVLKPGGSLVLSGILENQSQDLINHYRTALTHINCTCQNGWARVDGCKT